MYSSVDSHLGSSYFLDITLLYFNFYPGFSVLPEETLVALSVKFFERKFFAVPQMSSGHFPLSTEVQADSYFI